MKFHEIALAAALLGLGTAAAQQAPHPVSTQTPPTQTHRAKRAKLAPAPAPVVATPPVPVYSPPPTPENMPAKPPQVSYAGGMLTIVAENSTLGDILNAVKARTGATIDSPGPMSERVATRLGPAPPRQVLADLLKGSHYDYVMVGSDADPEGIRSVILTRNGSSPAGSGTATASGATPQPAGRGVNDMLRRMRGGPPAAQPAEEPAPEPEPEAEETPPPAQQQVMPPHSVGQGPQGAPEGQVIQPQPPDMNQAAQPGQAEQRVRTPEELLQELQRLQQQQQQEQQQQQQEQQ